MTRAVFLVGLFAVCGVACSDPCGELEDQCGSCSGSSDEAEVVEMACNAVVDLDNDDACDAALDSDLYECP
jgi:hypothetical protein